MPLTYDITLLPPPPTRSAFIDHAATLALRDTLVATHGIGSDSLNGFTGIDDTTGFTEHVCTTGAEFLTALNASSTAVGTKKLIKCAWNGVSDLGGTGQINGPSDTSLAAFVNAGEFGGYNYPDHATKIVAETGYSPIIGASTLGDSSLTLQGWGKIHVHGVQLAHALNVLPTATRPLQPLLAVTNCTLNTGIGNTTSARTMHIVDSIFDGATVSISTRALRFRFWGNEVKNKNKNGDLIVAHGYSNAIFTGLRPSHWVSRTLLHSADDVTESANHFDFYQFGVGAEAYAGLDSLIEFNLANCNMPGSQGSFADVSGTAQSNRILAHNNLFTINAYAAIALKDPSGTGALRFYRNTVLRAALGDPVEETGARLQIVEVTSGSAPTTGVYDIRENYSNSVNIATGFVAATTVADNVLVSNALPAAGNHVSNLFTGNGTWGTNGGGFTNYTDPGDGLSAAAAKAAIRAFYMPIGGYAGAAAGMMDPNTWPVAGASW